MFCLFYSLFQRTILDFIVFFNCIIVSYAAAAKSDSVRPHRQQPTRLLRPWNSPGKNPLEWVAISFSNAWKWKVKVKSLSRVRLLETPWTAAHQSPLSMGFSRQEYWSGVPLPSLSCHYMLCELGFRSKNLIRFMFDVFFDKKTSYIKLHTFTSRHIISSCLSDCDVRGHWWFLPLWLMLISVSPL